jgi:hypothetical protein
MVQKRLLHAGSIAAAIGAILGLFFTVGDRVTGVFDDDGSETPSAELHGVSVQRMTLRAYIATRTKLSPDDRPDYSEKEMDADVLAVDVRAQYSNARRKEHFPVVLTLERRDAKGRPVAVQTHRQEYYLETDDDKCVCHDRFPIPAGAHALRVQVQLLDPDLNVTSPVDQLESEWLRV